MSFVRAVLPFVAVAALVVPAPALAAETGLVGHWLIDAAKSDDVEKAISATVEKVNFVIRGFAHGRLKNTNQPYKTVTIKKSGDKTSVATDDRAPIEAPSNGTAVDWKREDGQVYKVKYTWKGDNHLDQTFTNEEGSRANMYMLEGAGMGLDVKVSSGKLPVPLTYKLVYKRGK